MAVIIFLAPVEHASGKIGQKSNIAFQHMSNSGRTYLTYRPGSGAGKRTVEQDEESGLFRTIAKRVKTINNTPQLKNHYLRLYAQNPKYRTFRAFLWARVRYELTN